MWRREREFVKAFPKKFLSQGTRKKIAHLPGRIAVTAVTHDHRCQSRETGRRGLFLLLMLRGIAGHYTPYVRQRITEAAALQGSFDEAAEMFAADGVYVSANQLGT